MESQPIRGANPQKRFGHTLTPISKTRAILFGGATCCDGPFRITGECFLFNAVTQEWKEIHPAGRNEDIPSPRAAHASSVIEKLQIIVFGGAVGHGKLADDELYLLRFKDDSDNDAGVWKKVPVTGKKPGARYGHSVVYFKPYIVVFGGNTGNEPTNDVWGLRIETSPFSWTKIEYEGRCPNARVYHTASIWSTAKKTEMVLVFGGRGGNGASLNDLWGLRRHNNGEWDWLPAPYRSSCEPPNERYQHSALCFNNLFLVIGGRNNSQEGNLNLSLEIFNLDYSEWYRLQPIPRFRHTTWISDFNLFIHGGFDPAQPNIPTGDQFRIDLESALAGVSGLNNQFNFQALKSNMRSEGGESMQVENSLDQPNQSHTKKEAYQISERIFMATNNQNPYVQEAGFHKLEHESKRLNVASPNQPTQQGSAHYLDTLHSIVLSQIMNPKDWKPPSTYKFPIKREIVTKLCDEVINQLKDQPSVIELRTPVKIYGSIHGQYGDLMRLFKQHRAPNDSQSYECDIEGLDYLFLGNYVDRGKFSLETICLLMALKLKFKDQVHLQRGSHEDIRINKVYGFADECQLRFEEDINDPHSVFRRINRVFEYLPLAAIVAGKIFCVHSGIGSTLRTVDEIRAIKRPLEINLEGSTKEQKIVLDLLWSDPVLNDSEQANRIHENRDMISSGHIVRYGVEQIKQFMSNNKFQCLIRSHECVNDGVEKFGNTNLYTVFSCTEYGGKYSNKAALLLVKKNRLEVVSKWIDCVPDSTYWFNMSTLNKKSNQLPNSSIKNKGNDEEDLRNRPITPPRGKSYKK